MIDTDCVFCDIVQRRAPATVLRRWEDAVAIVPLKPVAEGHALVLPYRHIPDAAADPATTAEVMRRAAEWAANWKAANIITSIGVPATQSVFHLHIHIVPRRENDGLPLPWTAQGEPKCSECGGRPKRGLIRSEDGQSWQCEGCYAELSRGLMTDGAET